MRFQEPRQASLDEVKISRDGNHAIIQFDDPNISTTHLEIGPNVDRMSDQEILELFNEVMASRDQMIADYDNFVIEIPPGSPQIAYHELSDQWVPRGGLLRCQIEDGGVDGETTFLVDDQELTLQQFGKMLRTYSGWGMRIAFVPDDLIHEQPRVELREPLESES